MTEVRDDLVANNKTVNWIPPSIGEGRFGNWLENIQDWGVSRNRYWGTPLNIWECPNCGKQICIGSREELKEASGREDALTVELHRPYIDEVKCKCPDCGKEMKRVQEVIDCWFDSGAMPFAQHHYPFENKELFESQFPAQFISEAVDQTRGWFYSLMAESTLLFNKSPYENVIVLGLVLDENGEKMSKSKGNAVDPFDALKTMGADAIRWYFYINSAPWLPNRFDGRAVQEKERKFLGTLWNTYAFYTLYAEIDQFDPNKYELDKDSLTVMDKWMLSKLNTAIKTVDDHLNNYRIPEAARVLDELVDETSNWYVRRSRERFWAGGMEQDKINAYMTLYTVLVNTAKIAAPMVPFITENIYQNLVKGLDPQAPESIHLCDFPTADESMIDSELEAVMDEILHIKAMGSAARNAANIKNRQPLSVMYVKAERKLDTEFKNVIRDELNVKEVEFKDDLSDMTGYTFKPQLKTVGPKYGKQLGGIKEYLTNLDGNAAMKTLKEEGALKFNVGGTDIELAEEDLLIDVTEREGLVTQADNYVTVVLDTNLTPELIEEGFVAEFISKVQTMRRDSGFEVMDHIKISINGNDKISEYVQKNKDSVSVKLLADSIVSGTDYAIAKEWNINGEKTVISLEKV
jgi:isoleucyl-tRNA synthetase